MVATAVMPATAQDTYENTRAMGSDLNGTARYVGMGGALDALGADLSTIGTNPAGIGLFRHSTASLSLGVVSQADAKKFDNLGKTNMSFDQAGFVYSMQTGATSFVNFAFNYHKSRNFDQILSADHALRGASLNKLAYAKSTFGDDYRGGYYPDTNKDGYVDGWRNQTSDERAYTYTQWDYLYTNGLMWDNANFGASEPFKNVFLEASGFDFDRAHRGWIADYDFNISGNIKNRLYLGFTLGVHDVHYKGYSEYQEYLVDGSDQFIGTTVQGDERKITGAGIDLKFGAIFRPIEESAFRIGLSVATPTWFELKSENSSMLFNRTDYNALHPDVKNWGYDEMPSSESYKFKLYTPWKFGLSLGHTIGNYLALGAGLEYADYSSADTRINDGYDYYGNEESYSDNVMNDNTEQALKGVTTIRLGAELKPIPEFAVRLGYNYVSPMYNENGIRDTQLNSIGNWYSSTADYTNWKATNRITCGFGYRYEKLSLDLAYQYSVTNGSFYPFQPNVEFNDIVANSYGEFVHETNVAPATSVSKKRHQLLFTIGYTF